MKGLRLPEEKFCRFLKLASIAETELCTHVLTFCRVFEICVKRGRFWSKIQKGPTQCSDFGEMTDTAQRGFEEMFWTPPKSIVCLLYGSENFREQEFFGLVHFSQRDKRADVRMNERQVDLTQPV